MNSAETRLSRTVREHTERFAGCRTANDVVPALVCDVEAVLADLERCRQLRQLIEDMSPVYKSQAINDLVEQLQESDDGNAGSSEQ